MDYLISVRNSTGLPISRGGFLFPKGTVTQVTVPERTLKEIRARKGLVVESFQIVVARPAEPAPYKVARKIPSDPRILMARKVGGRPAGIPEAPAAVVEPVTPVIIQNRRQGPPEPVKEPAKETEVPAKEPAPAETTTSAPPEVTETPAPAPAPEGEGIPEATEAPAPATGKGGNKSGRGKGPQEFRSGKKNG